MTVGVDTGGVVAVEGVGSSIGLLPWTLVG